MSMNKLSTELDCRIARFLVGDNKTLSALSRVSEYYRKVMEPFLYQALEFSTDESHGIQWLLLTFLDRPELASRINSLSMVSTRQRCRSVFAIHSISLKKHKWARAEKIRAQINEVVNRAGKRYDDDYKLEWLLKILDDRPNEVDGALALILCLLPNLAILRLSDSHCLDITMTMLGNDGAVPYRKLKELSVHNYCSNVSFVDLPPVESIVIENMRGAWRDWIGNSQLMFPPFWDPRYFSNPAVASLRSIVFIGLDPVTPAVITRIISSPLLVNIKNLVVKNCGICFERTGSFSSENSVMSALLRALEQHVPNLEHFEFTRPRPCIWASSLDTFKHMKKLRHLAVSFPTVADQGDVDWKTFFSWQNIFPGSLEYLTLENLRVDQLSELIQQFHAEIGGIKDPNEGFPDLLDLHDSLEPRLYLKGLAIAVDMDTCGPDYYNGVLELNPTDVARLRHLSDELMKIGTKFEVFRAPGPSIMFYKLLVKPGWTAPQPHSNACSKKPGDRFTALIDDESLLDFSLT